ncbi:MAG: twin-arginine translocase subunit TatB [Acidisphaera sp.]|nr:twin-arginine translocase subunit TatB [Acidisphaera sp.]
MFDFAWSEIALIGVVALVFIGPKDMPVAIKAVSNVVKKARKMAAEFQTHVDDMVKDTELADVRKHIHDIRSFDIKGTIERAIDEDGSIRRTFQDDPFRNTGSYTPPPTPAAPEPAPAIGDTILAEAPPPDAATDTRTDTRTDTGAELRLDQLHAVAAAPVATAQAVPAFIPPAIAEAPEPPAFIPPGTRSPGA